MVYIKYAAVAVFGFVLYFIQNIIIEKLAYIEVKNAREEDEIITLLYPEIKKSEIKEKGIKSLFTKRRIWIAILGVFLSIILTYFYKFSYSFVVIYMLTYVLTIIAMVDFDTQHIPTILNYIIGLIALFSLIDSSDLYLYDRLIGMICISVPLWVLNFIVPNSFGFGDIRLMFFVGLYLGWKGSLYAFFLGVIFAAVYAVWLILNKRVTILDHFAFGPFLCLGILISAINGRGTMVINHCIEIVRFFFIGQEIV